MPASRRAAARRAFHAPRETASRPVPASAWPPHHSPRARQRISLLASLNLLPGPRGRPSARAQDPAGRSPPRLFRPPTRQPRPARRRPPPQRVIGLDTSTGRAVYRASPTTSPCPVLPRTGPSLCAQPGRQADARPKPVAPSPARRPRHSDAARSARPTPHRSVHTMTGPPPAAPLRPPSTARCISAHSPLHAPPSACTARTPRRHAASDTGWSESPSPPAAAGSGAAAWARAWLMMQAT